MDDLDRRLIAELRINARASVPKLAALLGVAPGTVKARMTRLEETGVIADHVQIIGRTKEEYFYDLPDDLLGKIWKGKYRGQRQSWFLMRFTGEDHHIDIQTDHPEFTKWKWADPAGLPDIIVPFKRDLYRAVLNEFQPLI